MASNEAKRRASAKYDKANTKGLYLKLNKNTDALLIEYLENEVSNVQGLIKELLIRHSLGLDNYKSLYDK